MFVICALFIFMVRGCYQGDYRLDGQEIAAVKIIIMLSKITFHVIAGAVCKSVILSSQDFHRWAHLKNPESFFVCRKIVGGERV